MEKRSARIGIRLQPAQRYWLETQRSEDETLTDAARRVLTLGGMPEAAPGERKQGKAPSDDDEARLIMVSHNGRVLFDSGDSE